MQCFSRLAVATPVAVSLILAPRAVAGDGQSNTSGPAEVLSVRTGARHDLLQVETPDAAESPAAHLASQWVSKSGTPLPGADGLRLTSRVVFRLFPGADAVQLERDFQADAGQALTSAPGYYMLRFPTVRAAIAAAERLANDARVTDVALDMFRQTGPRNLPPDPNVGEQWHLKNTLVPIADVNVEPIWDAGVTGVGVTIGIADYGIQVSHPDLLPNINADATQAALPISSHGTSAAGVAAASAFNNYGCGVAYGARWSGQYVGGTDTDQADAEAFANDLNHIKSNSWGPNDWGYIAPEPPVIAAAVEDGVATGRGGLGEVFVWAGGNGAAAQDRTDYDGYANNRRVIAIGAIGDQDVWSGYSEPGSCLLAVAQSDGNVRKICTVTNGSSWTTNFGGTSSACPLAAGVAALVLQANPGLTWRDVQHVFVNSARFCDPNETGWITNAAGRRVSYKYGFGAVDAYAAAMTALTWHNVGHEVVYDTGVINVGQVIPDNNPTPTIRTVNIPRNMRIEAVELILNITHTYVGDLAISMTAPSGTESIFAQVRGDPTDNYTNFIYDSKRMWDETAGGIWTVKITDGAVGDTGTWQNFEIRVYGTPRCAANLNDDNVIDLSDLTGLLSAFGTCEGDPGFVPEADVNNSKCIDLGDLAYLLSVYGNVCP